MKKRLAAVVLAACIASCGLWACASQSGGAESAGDGAAQDQEAKASEQDDLEAQADAIKLLQGKEKVVAAQEFYAPKVTTTKDGTEVQLIPNDPYLWNTAILDGENRGCTAAKCHTSILDATQLLPMSHPELWNPYGIDPTIKFCYMCHSKALFMQDSMHALHMNSEEFVEAGGNCDSCHYINPSTGAYEMWDLVKYDTAYMGITSVSEPVGEFSFTQDSITPTDQVFYYWENADHQGVTPDNDTSEEAYANWEISVGGLMQNPFTFKLSDFEDQMVERVYKMDCQTNPPGGAYIANVNVKGIPLSAIMEKAGVDSSANALHSIADDGWDVYPVPMEYVQQYQDDILLVTEINGEKLGMLRAIPCSCGRPRWAGVTTPSASSNSISRPTPRSPSTTRASPTPRPARCSTSRTRPFSTTRTARSSRPARPLSSRASPMPTRFPSRRLKSRWTRAKHGRATKWARPTPCGG